jgi:hypothetical protein
MYCAATTFCDCEVIHVSDNKIAYILGPENLLVSLIEANKSIAPDDTGVETFESMYEEYLKIIKHKRDRIYTDKTCTKGISILDVIQDSVENNCKLNDSKDTQSNSWNPPIGLKIPSIRTSLLHKKCFMPIHPNSSLSCNFENEIFPLIGLFIK